MDDRLRQGCAPGFLSESLARAEHPNKCENNTEQKSEWLHHFSPPYEKAHTDIASIWASKCYEWNGLLLTVQSVLISFDVQLAIHFKRKANRRGGIPPPELPTRTDGDMSQRNLTHFGCQISLDVDYWVDLRSPHITANLPVGLTASTPGKPSFIDALTSSSVSALL